MTDEREPLQPCEVPGRATAEAGVVLLDGPDGVAVAMTPECARQTAESLRAAAERAGAEHRQGSASPNNQRE